MMNKRLSIAIVAYHNYGQIAEAVESLEKYTDRAIPKKIYILDNSGTDEALDGFLEKISGYDDITYLSNHGNLGFGKGHNAAIDLIESDYHAIVNPDILVHEDVFTPILNYLESNPDVGLAVPRIIDGEGNLQQAYRKDPTVFDMFARMFCKSLFPKRMQEHTLQNEDYTKPFRVPFAQGCFFVLRTDMFKAMKGFDDRYFMYMEDADLCRRINEKSRVMYFPGASVVHGWEKGSHKSKKLFKIHIASMISYFNKWGWKFF